MFGDGITHGRPVSSNHIARSHPFMGRTVSLVRGKVSRNNCASDRLRSSFGLDLPADAASLIRYDNGKWSLVSTWPYPLKPGVATGDKKFRSYGCPV